MLAARVEPKNAPQESEKTDNFKPLVFREFQAGVDKPNRRLLMPERHKWLWRLCGGSGANRPGAGDAGHRLHYQCRTIIGLVEMFDFSGFDPAGNLAPTRARDSLLTG
jgi:hypothetical protein